MAVLVEAISVVVRRDAIEEKYHGGWGAFVAALPNAPMCADEELACVGFLGPEEVGDFVETLERGDLTFLEKGDAIDLAVADQQCGLTTSCDWLEFGELPFGEGRKISACWFFDGQRMGAGLHLRGRSMPLATPLGWVFEGSLSEKFTFVPVEQGQS